MNHTDRKDFKFIFAPIGVAFGITVFILLSIVISKALKIQQISDIIPFLPRYLVIIIGIILLIFFLPVFILGNVYLNRRVAVGQSETLRISGIYKYTRNPMYIGISMTIIGIGLLLLSTREWLRKLVKITVNELPEPKLKKIKIKNKIL